MHSLRYPIRKLQSLTFNYNQFFNFNLCTNDDLFVETNPRPKTPFCHAESVSLISLSLGLRPRILSLVVSTNRGVPTLFGGILNLNSNHKVVIINELTFIAFVEHLRPTVSLEWKAFPYAMERVLLLAYRTEVIVELGPKIVKGKTTRY